MRKMILVLPASALSLCLAAIPLGAREAGTVKMILGQVSIESKGTTRPAAVNDRRSLGNQIDDQTIERAMHKRIKTHRDSLPGARVKAVAHNGTLLLIGGADDAVLIKAQRP